MLGIARKFVAHVVPSVVRPLHILWNELIAFIFFALAIMGAMWVYRQVRHAGGPETVEQVVGLMVGVLFAVIMAYFGFSSWWKARRISRP